MEVLGSEMILFDLNLLITLAVVYREKSVSQAAAQLRVTQPAVSNALKKLRDLLDDDLFVRSEGKFIITDKGQRLMGQVEPALISIQRALKEGAQK